MQYKPNRNSLRFRRRLRRLAAVCAVACAGVCALRAGGDSGGDVRAGGARATLEYRFDEASSSAWSTGALGAEAALGFLGREGNEVDLHSPGQHGVSALPGDQAFDNTMSTKMGADGLGGVAIGKPLALGELSSLTVAGWFFTDGLSFRNGARILDATPVLSLAAGGNGLMALYINGTSESARSEAVYGGVGRWVFFAATYDSTAAENNVRFYIGAKDSPVRQAGDAATYAKGPVAWSREARVALGNLNSGQYNRPFDGRLDNIRLFKSETGNDGALSLEKLEALRAGDVPAVAATSIPEEWTDEATGHRIVRVTRMTGTSNIQYFHQNAFTQKGDLMLFANTSPEGNRRLHAVDLNTYQTRQVTDRGTSSMYMAELAPVSRNVYYLRAEGEICETNLDTLATRVVAVIPPGWRQGKGFSINADETLLAGAVAEGEAEYISKYYPDRPRMIAEITKARLDNFIYIVSIKTGKIDIIHRAKDWLGHVQFSPTDPSRLMFCHEGPWEDVDRVWTMRTDGTELKKGFIRVAPGERVGHELWSMDGRALWYDWPGRIGGDPVTEGNALGTTNLATGEQTRWPLAKPIQWSMHYAVSADQTLFAGDGFRTPAGQGGNTSQWIFLYKIRGGRLVGEPLVDMARHDYGKLGPNVRFSPDGKKVFFQSNMHGGDQIYAVEINR